MNKKELNNVSGGFGFVTGKGFNSGTFGMDSDDAIQQNHQQSLDINTADGTNINGKVNVISQGEAYTTVTKDINNNQDISRVTSKTKLL